MEESITERRYKLWLKSNGCCLDWMLRLTTCTFISIDQVGLNNLSATSGLFVILFCLLWVAEHLHVYVGSDKLGLRCLKPNAICLCFYVSFGYMFISMLPCTKTNHFFTATDVTVPQDGSLVEYLPAEACRNMCASTQSCLMYVHTPPHAMDVVRTGTCRQYTRTPEQEDVSVVPHYGASLGVKKTTPDIQMGSDGKLYYLSEMLSVSFGCRNCRYACQDYFRMAQFTEGFKIPRQIVLSGDSGGVPVMFSMSSQETFNWVHTPVWADPLNWADLLTQISQSKADYNKKKSKRSAEKSTDYRYVDAGGYVSSLSTDEEIEGRVLCQSDPLQAKGELLDEDEALNFIMTSLTSYVVDVFRSWAVWATSFVGPMAKSVHTSLVSWVLHLQYDFTAICAVVSVVAILVAIMWYNKW